MDDLLDLVFVPRNSSHHLHRHHHPEQQCVPHPVPLRCQTSGIPPPSELHFPRSHSSYSTIRGVTLSPTISPQNSFVARESAHNPGQQLLRIKDDRPTEFAERNIEEPMVAENKDTNALVRTFRLADDADESPQLDEGDEEEGRQFSTQSTKSIASTTGATSLAKSAQVSVHRPPTAVVAHSAGGRKHRCWIDNINAKNSVMVALSFFYAMLVTIFALVFELSHLMTVNSRRNLGLKDMMFGIYMYGLSIAFLLYCYFALLLNPRWKRKIGALVPRGRSESSQNIVAQHCGEPEPRKVSHDSPSAGSLFLRLGCVVFGVIGTVYYAFNVFLCTSDDTCPHFVVCLDSLAIVFVFVQMHFVFCNWKLSICDHQIACRFGTMHLVATNLWTWIRYILMEESLMGDEIRQVFARHVNFSLGNVSLNDDVRLPGPIAMLVDGPEQSAEEATTPVAPEAANLSISLKGTGLLLGAGLASRRRTTRSCHGAECVLASFNEVMYTSIVEYSLIGAAVMFIVWKNIGRVQKQMLLMGEKAPVANSYVRRKHRIRMDCSKSTTGLFFGLAFLAGTFTSMAIFSGYTIMGQNQQAMVVFGFTDIVHYIVATCGCGIALWRMRLLRYHIHESPPSPCGNSRPVDSLASRRESASTKTATSTLTYSSAGTNCSSQTGASSRGPGHHSQELLDMILLAFGMTGEMIYSVAGLLGLTGSTQTAQTNWQRLTLILLAVHITRILQVGLQSCLIYIAGKLRVGNDPMLRERQPGKQAVTFLLLANISMFLMNLLEAEKAGVSETVVNFYGKRNWVFLVRSFSPLTIFYRFHSSVCGLNSEYSQRSISLGLGLAEVWKSTYSWKE